MTTQSRNSNLLSLQAYVQVAALLVSSVGLAGLLGWLFDIPALRSVLPGLATMKVNTALCFVAAASSLWLLRLEGTTSNRKRIGQILAGLVLLIGLLTLSQYIFHWNLGIDQFILKDDLTPANLFPGRMSNITAVCFMLSGLSLLLLDSEVSPYFAVSVLVFSLLALIGYLFDFKSLYNLAGFSSIALHTASALFILSLAILASRPSRGIMKTLTSDLPGSRFMRLLIPTVILGALLLEWLVETGDQAGVLEPQNKLAVLIVLLILVYSPLLYLIARNLNQAEEALRNSESNFRTLAEKSLYGIAIYQGQKMVYANESIARITGYTVEELKAMSIEQIVAHTDPIDRPIAAERLRKHTAGEGLSPSAELRILRKDGSSGWVQAFNNSIEYNGQPALLSTAIDIAERKKAEGALRNSESNFRTLAEKSMQGIVIYQDQKIVYVNPAHSDMMGYSIEELKAMSLEQVISLTHPADRNLAFERARNLLEGEQRSTSHELRIVRKDGVTRWLQTFSNPIDYYGRPALLSTTIDITERKRAEEALRKSERVLREAEVLGHTGSWEQDLITGEIFNTEENLRLFFGDDRSKGADVEDYAHIVHPDDREYVLRRRAELLEEEGPGDIEYRVVWPDGSVHVIFGRATVVRNELGKAIRVYGTNVDITERKGAEDALRLSEQRFQLLTETIPILVWSAKPDGVSDYYNAPFLQYLGKTLEEMQGWGWVDTLHPEDRERSSAMWTQAFNSGKEFEIEYRIKRAEDGQYRWHLGRAVPLRDSSGDIVRWYGTCTDIHDRKQAEEQIRQYAARMEELAEISRALEEVGLDYPSVLNTLAQRTAELIGDSCVITLFSDDRQRSFPVAFHHSDPESRAIMHRALLHTWQGGADTERYQTLLAGNFIYVPVVKEREFRVTLEPEFLPYLDAVGISSVLIVPLQFQGRVIGTLGVTRDRQGTPYTHDDQVLLQDVADRASLTIQNARLFEQVQGGRQQLEALSRRLLEVQESERRALTAELHDRVGQNLTGLSINLQNMKASLSDEAAKKLATKFDDAQALVEHTTRQIRDILGELHPPELEDYGLAVALETYAERAASRGNLELIADLPDLATQPSFDVSTALFRAAQEAINNVLKHADATQLETTLEERNGKILLRVEDNGRGFDPDAGSPKEALTWGLKIMRERIEAIGGNVRIQSELGVGTRVTFEIRRQP